MKKIVKQFLERWNAGAVARTPRTAAAPLMLALEPRVVYDASVAAVAPAAHTHEAAHEHAHENAHRTQAETTTTPATSATGDANSSSSARSSSSSASQASSTKTNTEAAKSSTTTTADKTAATTTQTTLSALEAAASARDTSGAHQVVFVDPAVANYQSLLTGLPTGTQVVILDANSDGFAQIAQYLQTHSGVSAIHLISHGADGEIQAGSAWLNLNDLSQFSAELTAIGAAMKPGGDFLIYGCDVAEDASGKALVQQIAALTHLNVAASTDATGATALGGNWTLEYQAGDVHTTVILSSAAEQQYEGLLAQTIENFTTAYDTGTTPTLTFTHDNITYTTDVAVESAVSTDPYLQTLPGEGSGSGALIIDTQGMGGISTVTISLTGGKHINLETLDIDVLANADVTITADGNTADSVTVSSDGLYTAEHISFAGHSSFANASTITITGGNIVLNIGRMVYSDPAPVLTNTTGATTTYTAGQAGTVIDSTVAVTDANGLAPQSATVTISSGAQASDTLSFTNTNATLYGNLIGSYNTTTHVLTLSSSGNVATLAQWQQALDAVTFSSTSAATSGNRTISYSLTDGYASSNTVTHTVALTGTFALTAGTGTTTFVQADNATSTPVTVDSGITVSDPYSATAHSATVTISSGYDANGDVLSFTSSGATGDITGSYSSGVLTLNSASGTATLAQWQAALRTVQFTDTSATASGSRTITFAMNDGTRSSTTSTHTVTVQHTDQTPLIADAGGTTSYVAGHSAATIDGAMTISDADNTTLASATITIASGYTPGDVLLFNVNPSNFGNISAAYSAGVLTLTSSGATATLVQWQAALQSIGFSSTSTGTGSRDITFTISDGTKSSALLHHTVTVVSGPAVVTDSGSAAFVAGDNVASTPVSIDSGLTVSDGESASLSSATVSITGNFAIGQDILSFTNNGATMGNINASYNAATGVMTLSSASGTATLAQWQAALRSVTYTNDAITPGSLTRTVSFQINDGTSTSAVATRTITVSAVDQTPVLSDSGGSTSYVAGGSSVSIDSGLSVSDLDNTTLASATVSISGGLAPGDVLSFTNTGSFGNIAGVYNAATGVLTLTSSSATATLAQWQAALESVGFSTPGGASGGTRTISFTVNDGTQNSAALSHNVVVASGPSVVTDGGSASFVAGDNAPAAPVAIDSGLTVGDVMSPTLASATISITGNFHAGEDVLGFSNDGLTMGNIIASYNAGVGVLTLTSVDGSATLAQWQVALRSVTYFDSAVTPNTATRTVSFQVNDGTLMSTVATRTVTVADTDQTPILSGGGTTTSFVAGDNAASTPVAIGTGLSISDLDNATLASASVSIAGNFQTGDVLGFVNSSSSLFGNIVASYNSATGVLTLTSAGAVSTLAQWSNALQAVTYTSYAITPFTAMRTISFTVSDGTKTSAAETVSVQVSDTDQTPVISGSGGTVTFTQGDNATSTPVTIDSGITLSDLDNTTLQSATVTIGNYDSHGDVIGFVNNGTTMGDITGSYSNGVLTLTSSSGTATLAQWQSALRSLTFTDTAGSPSNATRAISFVVNDGEKSSTAWTRSIVVVTTDQSPVLTGSGGSTAFTAGDNVSSTPVAVDTGITLTDSDSPTMQSATVAISGNFHAGEDVLALGSGSFGDITASYDSATGVLNLASAGASTQAQWQAALRSVTYTDTAITPDTATRTISFSVNDGTKNSASVSKTVTVVDTDQTPVLTGSQSGSTYLQGTSAQNIDTGMTLSDRDSVANPLLPMTITVEFASGFQSGDILALNYNAATMGSGFSVSFNDANGEFIVSASSGKSIAQWNAIIDGIQFSTGTGSADGARTLTITANDGTKTSSALSYTIDVVSSAPSLTTTSTGSASFIAGDNAAGAPVTVDGNLNLSDPLGNVIQSATISITGNLHSGEDVLGFVPDGSTGNISGVYNSLTGLLTLTSSGGATNQQWQAALRSVYFSDSSSLPNTATRTISFSVSDGTQTSATLTRTVTVTPTDQTPILGSASSGSVSFVAGDNAASTPVVIDNGVSVSDADNTTLSSATVQIGAGFHAGEDVLGFVNDGATMGDITASYNASTGTLTLTSAGASATLAQWQAALRSVTYTDMAVTPDTSARTISFSVNDGEKTSAAITRIVTVTDTDQTPILSSGSAGSASFVAGDNTVSTPVVIDNGIAVSDLDNTTLSSATVQIGAGFHAGEDVLGFVNDGATMGNITASYNASTGTLTLTSAGASATLAQWQAALRSVTYTDTAVTPDTSARTISFSVNDGEKTSAAITRTVTVTDTDQTPILSSGNSGTSASFVSADNTVSTPVVIDNGISVSDLDNTTLSSATVQIGAGFHAGEDVLGFVNDGATMGNITASYNASTGTLTLTSTGASATLAQWEAALRSVTYTDMAVTPDTSARTISFSVNDGEKTSAAITRTVTVTDTDQTPILSSGNSGTSASFVSADNTVSKPVVIDNGISVSDLDNATLSSATVQIGAGFHAGEDVLAFTNDGATMGNITASYNASTGTLTLTSTGASATLAQWQAALRSVTYTDTAVTPDTTARTIGFSVNDGTKTSTAITRTLTVTDTDQTPILSSGNSGTSASFVSADNAVSTPVVIDSGISVSDLDNATLSSATVQIGAGFHAGEDVLAFANDSATMGNITASYDASTGTLTLASAGATATLVQWQAALRAVTYTDTAAVPDITQRTISFSVNDGTKTSTAISRPVDITATHQTLVVSVGEGPTLTYTASGDKTSMLNIGSGVTLTDANATPPTSASVAFTGSYDAQHDLLVFIPSAATGDISGSYDASTGVLKLSSASGTATLAQWRAALGSIGYRDMQAEHHDSTRTIAFTVSDGTSTSASATRTLQIAGVPDPVGTPILPPAPVVTPLPAHSAPPAFNTPSTNPLIVNDGTGRNDGVSNPLIVLDTFVAAPDVGSIVLPTSYTFMPDGVHGRSLGNTHVDALDSIVPPVVNEGAEAAQSLPTQLVQALSHDDGSFSLSLMAMSATRHVANAVDTTSVTQADGEPLPSWLHYDAASGELSGVPPRGVHEVRVILTVRDAFGHVSRREVVVAIDAHNARDAQTDKSTSTPAHKGQTAKPVPHASTAKPSLAAQFASAHAALHVSHGPTAVHDSGPDTTRSAPGLNA